jgi:hypothetical protein
MGAMFVTMALMNDMLVTVCLAVTVHFGTPAELSECFP